jgi:P27 family predicted phage terminase small subunit
MSRGRKPKPLEILKLDGSYRADRHNGNPPKSAAGIPPCPKHLDAIARKEYRRIAKIMSESKTVTQAELAALTCYAQSWSRMIEAEKQLKITGLIIKSPAGFPCISPFLSVANRAAEDLRKWGGELGLSPAARMKIKVEPADVAKIPSRQRRKIEGA